MPLSTLDLDRNMFSYLVQMASMTLMRGWCLAKERNEWTYNSRPKGTLRSVHNIAMRLSDYAPAAPHHPIAALEDVTALFQDLYNGSQRAHFKPSLLGRHNYCMAMERFYKEEGSHATAISSYLLWWMWLRNFPHSNLGAMQSLGRRSRHWFS